ncbi:uncharacterized protein LOC119729524 [Patiria miniata]|uniref:Uncharacterized protein n=1 Tax=Patiria miniata TaxID=46514 RepID=A0A914A3T9_PATMI|nr:uncharacterized protein LOC119729524 [Patiria miniata]
MAGVVLSFFSLLVGAVLVTSVTSEAINFAYKVDVASESPDKIYLTLTATDGHSDITGSNLWKMSVFVSQNDDPANIDGAAAYSEQALDQAEQDQGVQPNVDLTFTATLNFALADLGGCEHDYKYVCLAFGKGDKPDPSFDLLQGYKTCLKLGNECLGDADKAVSFGGFGWGLAADGTFSSNVIFLASSRQNLAGNNLWSQRVGWTKVNDPATSDYLDLQDVLSAAQSSTSLVNGGPLSFSSPFSYDQSKVGCGVGQYRYLCVTFGKGDNADPDYAVSQSMSNCKLVYTCDDF